MNWINAAPYIVGAVGLGAAILGVFLRKYFIEWRREHFIIKKVEANHESCDIDLQNLAQSHRKLTKENAALKVHIEKLEDIINSWPIRK